ncbi:MAG: hypothetical protein K8823_716 [Cenarchaeum symbiont of Oopsacas minuta]|nr:hypothetical protein [Cenarchaeum symbiont of Oopsacas minuta]
MSYYQYSVARYVEDIARDEPINIGVMINKPNTNEYVGKFIPNIDMIQKIHRNANLTPLKIILEPFKGEHKSNTTLSDISEKFGNKLQFTKPRPIYATNLDSALNEIYEDFISIVENRPIRNHRNYDAVMIFRNTVNINIDHFNFSTKNYEMGYVQCHKNRKITFDFVFKNDKVQDAMKVIPISATTPKISRNAATALASDYRHIKNEFEDDVNFHTVIENLGSEEINQKFSDLAKADLKDAGCKILDYNDIPECIAEIRNKFV